MFLSHKELSSETILLLPTLKCCVYCRASHFFLFWTNCLVNVCCFEKKSFHLIYNAPLYLNRL